MSVPVSFSSAGTEPAECCVKQARELHTPLDGGLSQPALTDKPPPIPHRGPGGPAPRRPAVSETPASGEVTHAQSVGFQNRRAPHAR
jgi:hypothetical protein